MGPRLRDLVTQVVAPLLLSKLHMTPPCPCGAAGPSVEWDSASLKSQGQCFLCNVRPQNQAPGPGRLPVPSLTTDPPGLACQELGPRIQGGPGRACCGAGLAPRLSARPRGTERPCPVAPSAFTLPGQSDQQSVKEGAKQEGARKEEERGEGRRAGLWPPPLPQACWPQGSAPPVHSPGALSAAAEPVEAGGRRRTQAASGGSVWETGA